MFSTEELKNLSVLLLRVNLTGSEALAVASLQAKVNSLIPKETPVETKEAPTSE